MLLSQDFSLKLLKYAAGLDRRSVKEASFEGFMLSNVLFRLVIGEKYSFSYPHIN